MGCSNFQPQSVWFNMGNVCDLIWDELVLTSKNNSNTELI